MNASKRAWSVLSDGGSCLDAVEQGCKQCEVEQCDGTVGYGGSPDEDGETTLDAMIMDGTTHEVGSVGALRRIKDAISVARAVMEHSEHTLLVGELATKFAVQMGFEEESLTTEESHQIWVDWKNNSCQPNYWKNVAPNHTEHCGPYRPLTSVQLSNEIDSDLSRRQRIDIHKSHDTIGMVAIDSSGQIACGTSTNGQRFKIPGRVGDSPIVGAGAYCDKDVGGAAGTGDGDVMMRFVPSFHTVEGMRNGLTPSEAAAQALRRIVPYYPDYEGAIIAVNIQGEYGAACHGIGTFTYCVATSETGGSTNQTVQCIQP